MCNYRSYQQYCYNFYQGICIYGLYNIYLLIKDVRTDKFDLHIHNACACMHNTWSMRMHAVLDLVHTSTTYMYVSDYGENGTLPFVYVYMSACHPLLHTDADRKWWVFLSFFFLSGTTADHENNFKRISRSREDTSQNMSSRSVSLYKSLFFCHDCLLDDKLYVIC